MPLRGCGILSIFKVNTQTVGEAFAKGICKAFGVSYKAPSTSSSTTTQTAKKTIYRIQVGAFADKKNADAYLKKVHAAGFKDTFITTVTK